VLGRGLGAVARVRARIGSARPPREELVARHVAGRSFVDVGCMWSVHGALCFAAEDAGAATVTGVDVMAPTERFDAERARRLAAMRFVQGDIHAAATIAEVGPHDVVWCSGVLYHAPHPLLTLERLRSITGQRLILATETIPERRRRPNTCVFAPEPGIHPTHTEPFDPARGYVNWFWAITPSALRAMLRAAGFAVEEEHLRRYHATVVARPA